MHSTAMKRMLIGIACISVAMLVAGGCDLLGETQDADDPGDADETDEPEDVEDENGSTTIIPGEWVWIAGSSSRNEGGTYGDQGTAAAGNVPGGRAGAVTWIDADGYLWLFGGFGYDGAEAIADLNDLWRFDGTNWAWISGSSSVDQFGQYGTQGEPDGNNVPGARSHAASWIDGEGNLWLFGGFGRDGADNRGHLNDLWRFDGTNWTWIAGSTSRNGTGVYGTQGIPDQDNVPGARRGALSWTDENDILWLFGGHGYDNSGTQGNLNDLWSFNGTEWVWESGTDSTNQPGVYGTKGSASSDNIPGARRGAVSWIDNDENLWLFGGDGRDETCLGQECGELNDLWRYDGTSWTWIAGSSSVEEHGTYGTQGDGDPDNVPGARAQAASWIDAGGNLWLFGGIGYDGTGDRGRLNDLWRFSF